MSRPRRVAVRELEIRKVRIEHGVGEQAVSRLFVAALNNKNILKILGAPVRSSTQAMIFRRAVTIGGATRMVIPPGR